MTTPKIYKKYFHNPKLLLELNLIGPPSTIIYKKNNLNYDEKFKVSCRC